ncbi:TraB/GumN family protein [Candidatus Woesearchaeota archaeon]|nr:TraB/GumN family protein [Candidatus Woesearchaeota archaeon]
MEYRNLVIIGTSHVSSESVKKIQTEIELGFDVVAIELDKKRLYALLHPEAVSKKFSLSMIFKVGVKGFIFGLIAKTVQDKIGKSLGIKPGSDMLEAFTQARSRKIPVSLIDSDLELVLSKISKKLTFKEKFRFVKHLLFSLFFPKQYAKKYGLVSLDLSKVPSSDMIRELMLKMKSDFPTIYSVLVEERNYLMARRLYFLMHKNRRVLAVVGAGHEEDIIKIVSSYFDSHIDVV